MKFKIQELTDNFMQFVITDTTPSFVNTMRRVLIAEVPKMAIEDVEFHLGPIRDNAGKEYQSVSPLFDEIIAHRLGMIPIPSDLKLFNFRETCKCKGEGCPNCTIMYNLNKKGPCTVYSGDLEPLGDSKFSIKEDLIPLVKLDKDQALLIYATAQLGNGKTHVKWQPTSGVGYKYYPQIEIDNKLFKNTDNLMEKCVKICPKNILEIKAKKLVTRDNVEDCIMCDSCIEVCTAHKKFRSDKNAELPLNIKGDNTKFLFKFETDTSMTAKEAFDYTLKFLEGKFNNFREQVSKLK